MGNKILAYVGLGVVLLLLVGTFAMGGMNRMSGRSVSSTEGIVSNHGQEMQSVDLGGQELAKYRSEEIPEECQLPSYDNDVNKWKEHLGHHENTWYCLDYYKELEGGK